MSNVERVHTSAAPAPIGPYSQGIVHGNELYCSGQTPTDPATGELVTGDIGVQAERTLNNLRAVIEAAGFELRHVVKTSVFLVDMNDFAAVNAVYARFFGESKPARSTVAVAALPKASRVEIDAIAKR